MKRFLAFEGKEYYPYGGMGDFLGDYDTYEEARIAVKDKKDDAWCLEWAHIYDQQTKTTFESSTNDSRFKQGVWWIIE